MGRAKGRVYKGVFEDSPINSWSYIWKQRGVRAVGKPKPMMSSTKIGQWPARILQRVRE